MSAQAFQIVQMVSEGLLHWLACMIYLLPLPKKERFSLRTGVMLLVSVGLDWFLRVVLPVEVYPVMVPILFILFGLLMARVCCRTEMATALYLGIWAVLSYLMVYELWEFLCFYRLPSHLYGQMIQELVRFVLTAVIYLPLGFTVGRWMPVYISGHVGPRQTLSALLLYVVFVVLFSTFYLNGVFMPRRMTGALVVMSQLYTVTVLYLQTALFRKSAMQHELDTMNLMWHQQEAQYKLAKENIELINRKCHNLKHQVAAMRTMEGGERRDQYIREIEESVRIYDAIVKTNNETLDTVLTEKSLLCEANQIAINCVADGASLDFMDPVDLYTVMGNALDNAIEGVRAFEQKEMRVIDVLIYVRQRFLVISVTNPLKEELTFHEGLPVSIKPKNGYHGYGMRSMRYTAQKYGGELTVEAQDGCFALRMLIPLPQDAGEQMAARQN